MSDGIIQLVADGPGKKLDTEELVVGANTVHRERMQVTGASALEIARVMNVHPASGDYALAVRQAPTPDIINREFLTEFALTNTLISDGLVPPGSHIVLKGLAVGLSFFSLVGVSCRIGFGAVTLPTLPIFAAGVNGMIQSHGGFGPGSGVVLGFAGDVIAEGGDGEELRMTNSAPTSTETLQVTMQYYVATP